MAGRREQVVSTSSSERTTMMNVYIWDMDETLILLKSLLNGTYAESFNGSKDLEKGIEIGKMWEDHILQLCDDHFFYDQIENYNHPFLDSLSGYDDGQDLSNYDFSKDSLSSPLDDPSKKKLAYRHRVIADKYSKGLQSIVDKRMLKSRDDLYELTDSFTDSWLSSARTFLEQSSGGDESTVDEARGSSKTKSENINVLVTSGYLIPSLVKCMLFQLEDLILHQNVYSSWDVGKLQCFSWIKERFSGPNVRFCVIGDGWEECEAAESMRWPFVSINFRPGNVHRFPGLTLRTVGHYIDVVYEDAEADSDKL